MFFQKNDKLKSLIKKQKALKEDTYILFKGGMVSSDLIDIEVILKNNNHIRTKMIVDQKDSIECLCKRITEVLEKFSKISGLNKLKANNLVKKTERGFIQIRNEKQQTVNNSTCIKEEQPNANGNLDSNLVANQNLKEIMFRPEKSFIVSNNKDREELLNDISNYSKDGMKRTERLLSTNQVISHNHILVNASNLNITASNNIINNSNSNYNPPISNNNVTISGNTFCSKEESIIKKDEFKIGDFLESKDIIYFELEFEEIWLEVEMTLVSDDNKSLIISFEIKIQVNELITNLTKLLIKMGMKSWAKYILDIETNPDFYLLTHFKFINNSEHTRNPNSTRHRKSFTENQNFNNKETNNLSNSQTNARSSFKNNLNINFNADPKLNKNNTPNFNTESALKVNPEISPVENLNKNLNFYNTNIQLNGLNPLNENLNNDNYVNLSGCFDHLAEEEMDDLQERVKDKYNFQSKLKCQLEFSNFVDLIYRYTAKNPDEKYSIGSKNENNRKKIFRNIIREFMTNNTFKNEILSSHYIGFHKIIFWKCNPEEEESDRLSSVLLTTYSEGQSRAASFVEDRDLSFSEYGGKSQFNFYDSFLNFSKTKFPMKNPAKPDRNFESEFQTLKNINFASIIGKYARQYLNIQAYVALNIPDAKNFSKISKEGSFKSHETHFDFENFNFNMNNENPFTSITKKKLLINFINFLRTNPAYTLIIVLFLMFVFYLF